jgi:hypothetical protein
MHDSDVVAINREQAAGKIMDGKAIVINLTTGMYYSMTGTGAYIWSLIERGLSVGDLIESMASRFAVDAGRARQDLLALLGTLADEGLVEVRNGEGDGAQAAPADSGSEGGEPYDTPTMEKFSDMAEMFALDPPLPGNLVR